MSGYQVSNSQLSEAIIRVIAFFDLFDYPLTAYETWNNLTEKVSFEDVLVVLEELVTINTGDADKEIELKNGFYFLRSRSEIINIRQRRFNYSAHKMKIARRFTYFFKLLPFVKMVAVANSLGFYNLRQESDIDFFIITAPRRLWLSRLYCTGLAKILHSRPTKKTKQDRICLSFYISSDHLDISNLRLLGDDPYFDYWRSHLVLLYNKDGVYEDFLLANRLEEIEKKDGEILVKEQKANPFIDHLEKLASLWQLKIMPQDLKLAMNNTDGVVVNNQVLKLYQRDRRREFLIKYGDKISKIFKKNG